MSGIGRDARFDPRAGDFTKMPDIARNLVALKNEYDPSNFEEAGDDDVLRKIRADFEAAGAVNAMNERSNTL